MSVLSNGTLVGVTPAAGGRQSVWHWSQEKPASTYLYSVVIGPLTVLHDQWRGRPVDYWVGARHRARRLAHLRRDARP